MIPQHTLFNSSISTIHHSICDSVLDISSYLLVFQCPQERTPDSWWSNLFHRLPLQAAERGRRPTERPICTIFLERRLRPSGRLLLLQRPSLPQLSAGGWISVPTWSLRATTASCQPSVCHTIYNRWVSANYDLGLISTYFRCWWSKGSI